LNLELLLNKLKIKKGDKLLVTSNILKILVKYKKKEINFGPNDLIDGLKKKIGKSGTLFIPTYNWDFCKGKTFNYNKTPSQSGALGNIALKRRDFIRSFNPIYSLAVTGKDKNKICNAKHLDCFSLNSPFGYLIKNKGKNIFIDITPRPANETKLVGFVFHHVIEQAAMAPYRYLKEFKGYYVDKKKFKKLVKIKLFVTKFNYKVYIRKNIDIELIRKKLLKKINFNGIKFSSVDIYQAFKILTKDLRTKRKFFIKKY